MDDSISVFRHYLATLAFRFHRVTDDAPDGFAGFDPGSGVRSPIRILRHMSVLMYFAKHLIADEDIPTLAEVSWSDEVARFRVALTELDATLKSGVPLERKSLLKALQGPLADAMTHVGQLATLRRMAGKPIEGISYAKVDIEAGKF